MTPIVNRNNMLYVRKRGLYPFPIFKTLLAVCLTVALFLCSVSSPPIETAQAVQQKHIPTTQEKMVWYIMSMNSKLDFSTAQTLADAMIKNSIKYKIPVELQLGLVQIESHFDQYAISSAGAMGFFQVMPKIHRNKLVTLNKIGEIASKNIYDPVTQVVLGNSILRECINKHRGDVSKGLACYNGSSHITEYSRHVIDASNNAKRMLNA